MAILPKKKDPDALLDYRFDWSEWLAPDGDSITDHEVEVPAGLTKVSSSIDDGALSVTVWLSGGTVGVTYPVVCRITTDGGRIDDRTMKVKVEQR